MKITTSAASTIVTQQGFILTGWHMITPAQRSVLMGAAATWKHLSVMAMLIVETEAMRGIALGSGQMDDTQFIALHHPV